MKTNKYFKLIFENQSSDTKTRYKLIRETKSYVFIQNIKNSRFIFRVHKKTLNIKGICEEQNYRFDVPRAIFLEEVFE